VCCSVLQRVAVDYPDVSSVVQAGLPADKAQVSWRVAVCCDVLQCGAVRCCVLQCVAVRCSVLQWITPMFRVSFKWAFLPTRLTHHIVLRCVAMCCSVVLCVAVCCCALQCVAVDYPDVSSVIQVGLPADKAQISKCVAVCCSVLQCVAVDYPDVSSVIQAGLPSDKAQVS